MRDIEIYSDYGLTGGKPGYKLLINKKVLHGRELFFLDHCASSGLLACSDVDYPKVYLFRNGDNQSKEVDLTGKISGKIRNGFFCNDGKIILQTSGRARTYVILLGDEFSIIESKGVGDKQWHGSWSIDESSTGCIMYAEYSTTKEKQPQALHVYRSKDGGATWNISLKVMSSPVYGYGDIRHFHVCQADPFIPKRWYVASGDKLSENKLYVSDDDGVNWRRIEVKGCLPAGYVSTLHWNDFLRFTAVNISEERLSWATDDNVGGERALLCHLKKSEIDEGKISVYIDGFLGKNLARNMVQTELGSFITTEAKLDPTAADLYLVGGAGLVQFPSIENFSKKPSGFTVSKSSRVASDGRFFSLSDFNFLNSKNPSLLEFQLERFDNDDIVPDFSDNKAKATRDSKIVFFHAQRTAGSFLKSLFIEEYGKEKCLFYQTSSKYCKWSDVDKNLLSEFRVYVGHENYSDNAPVNCGDLLYMSVIRHPVDRAISLYYYLKKRPEHKLHKLSISEDIETFFRKANEVAPDYISDTQTLRVSGSKNFAVAKKILDDKFYLVAPFQRLPEIVDYLSKDLRWKTVRQAIQSPKDLHVEHHVDNAFSNFVKEINPNDFKLYEYSKLFLSLKNPFR